MKKLQWKSYIEKIIMEKITMKKLYWKKLYWKKLYWKSCDKKDYIQTILNIILILRWSLLGPMTTT